jgi:hypothetical protein
LKQRNLLYYEEYLLLQRGEQTRFALLHLLPLLEQSPLQEHLIGFTHALEISGIVVQTGTHDPDTLVQARLCGKGIKS